jgi:DNA-binding phage protein
MRVNELKAEAVRKGLTIDEVAEKAGIKKTTMWRRIQDSGNFTIKEIESIANTLDLSGIKILEIFFDEKVS